MRLVLMAVLGALSGFSVAAPECTAAQAVELSQKIFNDYNLFYAEPSKDLMRFVTPSFEKALKNHYRCMDVNDGMCHIDYDPWISAQDGEIAGKVRFSAKKRSPKQAEVKMTYLFVLDPKARKKEQSVTFKLAASGRSPLCWAMDDFVSPGGEALAARFSSKKP